jgi:hypothetical protein
MPRWYKGFQCGRIEPQTLVERIKKQVQQNDLGHLIPVVRVEKRPRRGGYYLFLGIESPVIGQVPEEVQPLLRCFHQIGHALDQPLTFDEIRPMSAEYSVYDYVRLIPYLRRSLPPASDPFEEAGIDEETVAHNEVVSQTQQYDRLLTWLSAMGQGSWQVFHHAWQSLGIASRPQQVLRRLRLLGHIETSVDRKRWTIAPSVVFPITTDERVGRWILCGQRNTRLLQHFHQRASVEIIPQPQGDGPAAVYLDVTSASDLATILGTAGQTVYQVEQPGLTLARVLPSLDGWKQSLESLQGIRPHEFTLKRFTGNSFDEVHFSGESGLYELWPLKVRAAGRASVRPDYTLYYDATEDRWLRADWYGLRFLARYDAGQLCPVRFNSDRNQLAVPADWRWPEVYERALVLASGRLPLRKNGWLIYEHVGAELVDELRDKLRLSDEEYTNA